MTRAPAPVIRCPWPGIHDPSYARYHDEEWGVPHGDSAWLFEKLILEGFQAGLSWLTILKKREAFRDAFAGFDADRMARFGDRDVKRLMSNTGIVRNRMKIEAAIANARAYLALSASVPFSQFLWSHLEDGPVTNHFESMVEVPDLTPVSTQLSKSLKGAGFAFVGPTTVYAFMQSSGMVNDHLTSCPRHSACARLQRQFTLP